MSPDVKPLEPVPESSPVELPPPRLAERVKSWLLAPPLRTEQLLELIECPDRNIARCALVTVGHLLADGETEVTVLVPDRVFGGAWARLLHDETAHDLARELARLPHANVTTVPFHLDV